MFNPKQLNHKPLAERLTERQPVGRLGEFLYNLAMLTMILPLGKLFNTFPAVLSPNVRNPAKAMRRHATIDIPVE